MCRFVRVGLFVISLGLCFSVGAAESPSPSFETLEDNKKWTSFKRFVPEKYDYYVELGSMWEKRNQYWLGAGLGKHLGRCVFTESQTCQQYWDLFGGAGGRDGLTTGLIATGPRWQFVNFPDPISPSLRVFLGAMNIRDKNRDINSLAYGVGYGWTVSVHNRVNLRAEARLGYADQTFAQLLFSVHLKMDEWVNYFAEKLKKGP